MARHNIRIKKELRSENKAIREQMSFMKRCVKEKERSETIMKAEIENQTRLAQNAMLTVDKMEDKIIKERMMIWLKCEKEFRKRLEDEWAIFEKRIA